MRLPLFSVTAMLLAGFATANAAPCVPDTLANYVALASTGCEVGNAQFRDFGAVIVDTVVGGSLPDDGEIIISPTLGPAGPALIFSPGSGTGTSWQTGGIAGIYTATIGFTVASTNPLLGFLGSELSAEGSASGIGVASILEVQCLGGLFTGLTIPPPACLPGGITAGLGVDITSGVSAAADAAVFLGSPVYEIDVIKQLSLVSVVGGTAEITSFTEGFTQQQEAVPEPTTLTLLGGALLAFVGVRRYKSRAS